MNILNRIKNHFSKYEPLPDYGTLLTIKNFEELCDGGTLIDYDGHGYFAFSNRISKLRVIPSDYTSNTPEIWKDVVGSFTHVMWFNR